MYRVELKVNSVNVSATSLNLVPNVPCGVESWAVPIVWSWAGTVPNVPCGVESRVRPSGDVGDNIPRLKFLMYRVELKVTFRRKKPLSPSPVPNVPCGVESRVKWRSLITNRWVFLMYRVELKGLFPQ